MDENEECVSGEIEFPIGTPVAVLRADGRTFVGYGTIEAWLRFSEIPDEKDEPEKLANTDRIGVPTVKLEDVLIFCDDKTTKPMGNTLEEILEEDEFTIPRIRLESGEITYGFRCYFQLRSEYEAKN